MRKGKIRDVHDRDMDKPGQKHVIIERDETGIDPLHDWDQVFYLHSNVPRHFRGNECDKSYPGDPMVEIEDADGFGTGRYKPRDGVILFPVSAYIHSGIALRLGTVRKFACDPGGWDTTPNAAWMWTDRERWEDLCGEWMEIYDESEKKRRPAKEWDEFVEYARSIAQSELETLQKCWDGEVFGYRTETSYVPYKKLYEDGSTEDEVDWEDGDDSCWGYVVDKVDDIDFPKGDGWEVFDATGRFVGDEYDIPEFVVTKVDSRDGMRCYLGSYIKDVDGEWDPKWTSFKDKALRFDSFRECQKAAEAVIGKGAITVREMYNPNTNCAEIDAI